MALDVRAPVPPGAMLRGALLADVGPGADDSERLQSFLASVWGRTPLHLPGALTDFEIPLDPDELAGIACEAGADARLIRTTPQGLELEEGPFASDRFDALGDRDWTLLVNAVDLWVPGFEPLLEAARFVPDWRLDDVMVSFAAPGGSVGPHYDRYDVFLLQAQGQRRWELGPDPAREERTLTARNGLALIDGFTPERSILCAPGDGLYVPPGCVHHGIAETPCLTLSIGLRAPSLADLLDDWVLGRIEEAAPGPLALDPPLPADPAMLDASTLSQARALLRSALLDGLDDERFERRLGTLLTQPGRGAAFEEPPALDEAGLRRELAAGAELERAAGMRLLMHGTGTGTLIFAAGETLESAAAPDALRAFGRLRALGAGDLRAPEALSLAAQMYNRGLLILTEPDA